MTATSVACVVVVIVASADGWRRILRQSSHPIVPGMAVDVSLVVAASVGSVAVGFAEVLWVVLVGASLPVFAYVMAFPVQIRPSERTVPPAHDDAKKGRIQRLIEWAHVAIVGGFLLMGITGALWGTAPLWARILLSSAVIGVLVVMSVLVTLSLTARRSSSNS